MFILKNIFYSFIILAATTLLFLFLYTQYTQETSAATTKPFSLPSGTYVEGQIFVQYSQSVFDAHQIAVHRTGSGSDSQSSRPSATDPVKVVKDFFVDEKYTPTVIGTLYDLRAQLITIEKNGNAGDPLKYISNIQRLPGVMHVQPNLLYEIETPPKDWWLDSTNTDIGSIGGMWHLTSTQVYRPGSNNDAWDLIDALTNRSYKPRVAIIDDGILTSYDDFSTYSDSSVKSIRSQECKIPEFTVLVSGVGSSERVEYTPKTETCPEAGIGYDENEDEDAEDNLKLSFDVDHAYAANFHGTKVASVLTSNRNNDASNVNSENPTNTEKSGAGVASGLVDLIPIRAYRSDGGGFDTHSIVRSIAFARLNNVDIINASFGSTHSRNFCGYSVNLLMRQQIEKFGEDGGLFVTTAGNKDSKTGGSTSVHLPSDFNQSIPGCEWTELPDTIIVVGGTEKSDNSDISSDVEHDLNGDGETSAAEREIMSIPGTIQEIRWNRDWQLDTNNNDIFEDDEPWVGSDYNHKVNIAAPAKLIVVPESAARSSDPRGGYGTSYAAPQVAGTLALMKYANSALSASDLKEKLEESADELISLVGPDCTPGTTDDYVERGRRLNAYNAVQAALGNEYTKKTISHSDRGACLCAGISNCEYGACGSQVNTCLSGTLSDIPDTTNEQRWICRGQNGGIDSETCSIAQKSCTACTTNLGTLTSTVTRPNQTLVSTCNSESRPGKHASYYTFTLRSAAEVTIDLTSDTIDMYLFLHKHDGAKQCGVGKNEDSNDDRGGDSTTHSRITKTLTAGTYIIEATTFPTGRTGSFDLKITPTFACATAIDGGWTTLPTASTITCGTTQTAKCDNPAPSCGGSQCSGNAPSVTGTKCTTGYICSAGSCVKDPPICTGCTTWESTWEPAIVNQCGNVDQEKECKVKSPAGCAGTVAPQKRTINIPTINGGWSDTTWGTCTCTASKADSASAGTQTGTRTCTNPTRNRCGTDCSGSATPTRTCTVSAGNCPVTPTSCSWQRVSCGTKVCGPQQAVCGPTSCTGTCPYTGSNRRAQPGDTGTYANGCGTCSNGETCNTSGQCTNCTAVNGGWTTLPAASTITCGTTQTATCENPAPSCGGSQCSGTAPTVTGTKCSTGNICSAGSCIPSCTTAPTPSTFTVTAGDTTLRADFTLFNNLYAYQRAISDSSATCAGSTWGVESDGHQDYTNLINGKTYYICLRSRWKSGACTDWSASRVVTGTPTAQTVACSWQNNSCTNKCGTITGTCGPTGCTGTCRYTNDRRAQPGDTGTRNCGSCSSGYTCSNNTCVKNPTTRVDGGWSSWSSCTCTSATNDGNAGTQTRTCTNPAPSGGGSACSGSSSQSCTASGCATTSSCSRNSDCGSSEYCESRTCKSCTWGGSWCNSAGTKVMQTCKDGGVSKRYRTVETCSSSKTCSGGSCVAKPTTPEPCDANQCGCGSTRPWCDTNTRTKRCYCSVVNNKCIKRWSTSNCPSGQTCSWSSSSGGTCS